MCIGVSKAYWDEQVARMKRQEITVKELVSSMQEENIPDDLKWGKDGKKTVHIGAWATGIYGNGIYISKNELVKG